MDAQTIKSCGHLLAAILTENYILNKFLGICPFLGVSKKLDTAVGMSCAVTVATVISTAVTWPLYTYLLVPNGLGYLQTIVFILVIGRWCSCWRQPCASTCRPCNTPWAFTCPLSPPTAPCWV